MVKNICIAVLMQLAVGSVLAAEKDCSAVTCPSKPKHYEEMGCEAVIKEGSCCAESYKCPDYKARDQTKCFYKNEVVNVSQDLSKSALEGTCTAACYCREGRDGEASSFNCAHIDCPEFFGSGQKSKNCIRQYDNKHCCSIESVCDDEVQKLATCEFEGETYREGQKIYPEGSCYRCFCDKNFDGKIALEKNSNCHKIECAITLHYLDRIRDGCIPTYYEKDNCCPIGWECPSDEDKKSNVTVKAVVEGSAKCKFGNLEFNVGESLHSENDCKSCSCLTPPMLHCIQSC